MRKIINKPEDFVRETVEGIIAVHRERPKLGNGDYHVVLSNKEAPAGKVDVVTGDGSGHLPIFLGYMGKGMLGGYTVGSVFASLLAGKIEGTIRTCGFDGGVLYLYGNCGGDDMGLHMACESVEVDDIETRIVKVCDDVASSPKGEESRRRGIARIIYTFKIAGVAAEQMRSLHEMGVITKKALGNIRSMGAALSPRIIPQVGKPTFTVRNGEIEIGIGIRREAGIGVRKMMVADELSSCLLREILKGMELTKGGEVSVMVNSLGATPLEEQMIIYRNIHQELTDMGTRIVAPHIGGFATSIEAVGVSLTVFRLDGELKELLLRPAVTPFYRM